MVLVFVEKVTGKLIIPLLFIPSRKHQVQFCSMFINFTHRSEFL